MAGQLKVLSMRVIILEPKKLIPADQQWFWTEKWQVGEREAQAEIEAGKVKHFDSMEEFNEIVHHLIKPIHRRKCDDQSEKCHEVVGLGELGHILVIRPSTHRV